MFFCLLLAVAQAVAAVVSRQTSDSAASNSDTSFMASSQSSGTGQQTGTPSRDLLRDELLVQGIENRKHKQYFSVCCVDTVVKQSLFGQR